MARRTTSPTKGRAAARATASDASTEQTPAKSRRRGKKAGSSEAPVAEGSLSEAFFPGADDVVASVPDAEPVRARRGRKPKAEPLSAPVTIGDDGADETRSPTTEAGVVEDEEAGGGVASPDSAPVSVPPSLTRRGRQKPAETRQPISSGAATVPAAPHAPAARWDNDAGTASFDWPTIEKVAAADGPNQIIAKLLLAARAEGANSRWPF